MCFSAFVIAGGEAGGEGHVHVAAARRTHSVDYISPHIQLFLPSSGEFYPSVKSFCRCVLLCLQGEINLSFFWEVTVPWSTVNMALSLSARCIWWKMFS